MVDRHRPSPLFEKSLSISCIDLFVGLSHLLVLKRFHCGVLYTLSSLAPYFTLLKTAETSWDEGSAEQVWVDCSPTETLEFVLKTLSAVAIKSRLYLSVAGMHAGGQSSVSLTLVQSQVLRSSGGCRRLKDNIHYRAHSSHKEFRQIFL